MMNYFSFNPNFSLQLQQCPQAYPARSSLPSNFVLNTLSLALTNSILNYQNVSASQQVPPVASSTSISPPSALKQPPLTSTSAEPTQTETQLTVQKQNKGTTEEKTDVPQIALQIDVSSLHPSAKIDQRPEPKLASLVTPREQNHKKKVEDLGKIDVGKVEVCRPAAVPVVDLIETAYLRQCKWEREGWCVKRLDLLARRVDQWTDKGKNRRDKRQLRLLQN